MQIDWEANRARDHHRNGNMAAKKGLKDVEAQVDTHQNILYPLDFSFKSLSTFEGKCGVYASAFVDYSDLCVLAMMMYVPISVIESVMVS